jgi:hypothetical protein
LELLSGDGCAALDAGSGHAFDTVIVNTVPPAADSAP